LVAAGKVANVTPWAGKCKGPPQAATATGSG